MPKSGDYSKSGILTTAALVAEIRICGAKPPFLYKPMQRTQGQLVSFTFIQQW